MPDLVERLQTWYQAHSDGEWEHRAGVTIETLDSPGWSVRIHLRATNLEGRQFSEINDMEPESDWIRCWIEDEYFQAVGGPRQLKRILSIFLDWAESPGED